MVIFFKPGRYPRELIPATEQMTYLSFRYLICDLGRLPVDEYLDSRNVVSRILLLLMNHPLPRSNNSRRLRGVY